MYEKLAYSIVFVTFANLCMEFMDERRKIERTGFRLNLNVSIRISRHLLRSENDPVYNRLSTLY